MMKNNKITNFLTATLLLVVILLQSAHQIEHHCHESHHQTEDVHHHHEENKAFENTAHCQLCDFTLSPTSTFSLSKIEVPIIFEFNEKRIQVEFNSFNSSKLNTHKQLRAPPFIA